MGMVVYWSMVRGAEDYYARSTTGQNCSSSADSFCIIDPVVCGQNYTVTVTAENTAGPSDPSQPQNVSTCEGPAF